MSRYEKNAELRCANDGFEPQKQIDFRALRIAEKEIDGAARTLDQPLGGERRNGNRGLIIANMAHDFSGGLSSTHQAENQASAH